MSYLTVTSGLSNPVPASQGGTGLTSYTTGDLLYASNSTTLSKLGIGGVGQVLTVAAGIPSWAAAAAASPLTAQGDLYGFSTVGARVPVGTDDFVLTADMSLPLGVKWAAAAGGTPPNKEGWFAAESLQPLETNSAVITKVTGSSVKTLVGAFDDTTEQYLNGKLQVPAGIDIAGTVTFRAYVFAATAVADKNIALTFGHVVLNNSSDFDVAYTDENSGDKSIDATQDNVTEVTWTETVSNLGWAANNLVLFRISRPDASADDLAGDMYLMWLSVEIPRSS